MISFNYKRVDSKTLDGQSSYAVLLVESILYRGSNIALSLGGSFRGGNTFYFKTKREL